MIVAALVIVTAKCVTVKVAVELPAGTVMLAGTEATVGRVLLRITFAPPAGATPSSVTVAVTEVCDPPTTNVGDKPIL